MTDNDEKRPSPEALLKLAQAEEADAGRGKLKIFLGYAAGVGKTFAMLEAAWQRKLDEKDVVAAYVLALERGEPGAVYNVCCGCTTSVREVLDLLIGLSGLTVEVAVQTDRLR